MNKIPVYQAYIFDEEDGIMKISLVDEPAVMVNFVTLAKNKTLQKYSIQNEEQHILLGVVMVANTPIYRYDERMGEYYIEYSKEVIKEMAEKFIKDGNANNINLQHLDGTDVEGVNLVELFIKDEENGISPIGFENVPNGSLFAKYKVHSNSLWSAIKKGEFNGFSLEGNFSFLIEEDDLQEWTDVLNMMKECMKQGIE